MRQQDPNIATNILIQEIKNCIDMAKVSGKKKKLLRKDWMSEAILKSCETKEMLYNMWKLDKDNERLKENYKKYNKILSKVIYEAKNNYEKINVELNCNNPRKLWQVINSKINKNKTKQNNNLNHIIDDSGKKITEQTEIANEMNNYFSDVGTKLSQNIIQPMGSQIKMPKMNEKTLFLKPTDHVEIGKIINNMKIKGGGVDMINTKTLKTLTNFIAHPLSYIINMCFEQAIWPDALKMADIIPIHKAALVKILFVKNCKNLLKKCKKV